MGVYTASLSRTQGRSGWSVIFRHPALTDPRTGKPGKRVRYGLGTRDDGIAKARLDEINELLADERWWSPTAENAARSRFHPRVVDVFYGVMEPTPLDQRSVRDGLMPLPSREDGYRSVLLLGTTGAGKTTLLRHLIGTDPIEERFPTTATGRTTIADTEVVTTNGAFHAAVTFFPLEEVREHLEDCILQAVLAAHRRESRAAVLRALLQHPEQRFRFNYVLGDGPVDDDDLSVPEEDLLAGLPFEGPKGSNDGAMPELGSINLDETNATLAMILDRVVEIGHRQADEVATKLHADSDEDQRVVADLVEEALDELLREDNEVQKTVDELIDEIATRFELIDVGEVSYTRQSWPTSWSWETNDRAAFVRHLRRFTSNAKVGFGRLLTPLVSGVRVAGPFGPKWLSEIPQFVIFDTEGLGHTPDSSSSIPTHFTRRIDDVDAVVLVDNAEQPMQAAPAAAMRALAQTGHAGKLFICFTHFDTVTGENLPTDRDKARHVLKACETVVTALGSQLGPFAERALRARFQSASYFLGDLDGRLDRELHGVTLGQLQRLVRQLELSGERPTLAVTRPVYEQANLVIAIREAVEAFHGRWDALLGLEIRRDVGREHWARVKALSRRFAERMGDEYLHLRPVADLQKLLQQQIYTLVQNPIDWSRGEPSDDEKQVLYEEMANRISRRLLDLATVRIGDMVFPAWQAAWRPRGPGSTRVRAKIIAEDVYGEAAPIPRAAPASDSNRFLHDVIEVVHTTAAELNVQLR